MNHTQVAKVIHEATRALGETKGEEAQPKWEDLPDQKRTDKGNEVAGLESRKSKGVSVDELAKNAKDKLKVFIEAGIADAFVKYEKSLEKQGEEEDESGDEDKKEEKEEEPKDVADALSKADKRISASDKAKQVAMSKSPLV